MTSSLINNRNKFLTWSNTIYKNIIDLLEMAAINRYEFYYGEDKNMRNKLVQWIEDKIKATWRKNKNRREGNASSSFHRLVLEGLSIQHVEMETSRFILYSRDMDHTVKFKLNQITGDITLTFVSPKFGAGDKNPWWCLSKPASADSTVCGNEPHMIEAADAPYDVSILEYIKARLVRRIPGSLPNTNGSPKIGGRRLNKSRKVRKTHNSKSRKYRV